MEVHKITKNISEVFAEDLHTPKVDEVLDSMCWDQNDNICVTLDVKGESHKITTNFRKSRKYSSVDVVKDDLRRIRNEIRMCISDNVTDQNSEESLTSMMSCFDLDFNLNLPDRISKLDANLLIYGNDYRKIICQKWVDHEVQVTYKKRVLCTKAELIDEVHMQK